MFNKKYKKLLEKNNKKERIPIAVYSYIDYSLVIARKALKRITETVDTELYQVTPRIYKNPT